MMRDVNWKMIEEVKEGKVTAKIVKEKGKKDKLIVRVNNHVFEWKGFWKLVG